MAQVAPGAHQDVTQPSSDVARAWDEAQYRDLFERAVEGIFRTTASGRALSVNLAGAQMLGYDSPEEMLVAAISDTSATWIDPDRRAELVERVRTAGAVSDFEYEVQRRDGSTAWLSMNARAVWAPDVPELVIEGQIVDVTERREGKLALSDSRQRYSALFGHMAEGVVSCRMLFDAAGQPIDWIYLDVNPAFEELTGLSDVGGRRATEVIPGVREANPELFEIYGRVTATGIPEHFETYLPALERWFAISAFRPEPEHFAAVFENITKRKLEAQALRESEQQRERLAAIVEESADGIVITDADQRVVYANKSFVASSGRGLPELIGQAMSDVMRDVVDPATIADIDRTITAGRRWVRAVDRVGVAGTIRHVEVSVTPRRGPDGAVSSYVSVTRDVTELREAEAELVLQTRIREAMTESLRNVSETATLEEAAEAICAELVALPYVDLASIQLFLAAGEVQILAQSAPPGYPVLAGTQLSPARAASVRERSAAGPWARYAEPDAADGGLRAAAIAVGLKALAYGPIRYGDRAVGCVVLGTFDEHLARTVVEKMPGIVSFGAASSVVLAERMHARGREAERRRAIMAVLDSGSFHPVFQPIVDLASGEVVGYEALTRFDSGQPPHGAFADAWSVGLGPDLELATLEAAVTAGKRLPPGRWLDLNASARLLANPDRVRSAVESAERPIVIEITEHEVIDDYEPVREAVRDLGPDIRLAVDDAGAGVANFGHIIDLRPDFVKLDISLVRLVNADLGRQAMVVGMRYFARTAGCRLIAEGIETEDEARSLTGLGVEFGQGYLYGHPEPVEVWAGDEPARRLAQ